jgi:hypothetical protein
MPSLKQLHFDDYAGLHYTAWLAHIFVSWMKMYDESHMQNARLESSDTEIVRRQESRQISRYSSTDPSFKLFAPFHDETM